MTRAVPLKYTHRSLSAGSAPNGDVGMALLVEMPAIDVAVAELKTWGETWARRSAFDRKDSMRFGKVFEARVASALATMLGGVPVRKAKKNSLLPEGDCVECGECRVIGGIRPQNYDVCYRPDGVRFAFDCKTLNDAKSLQKNYQNMINDLATEATTVHTRFPYAIVGFMVVVPVPVLVSPQKEALTGALGRLSPRHSYLDSAHKAEVAALVLWDPATGAIDPDWPQHASPLRIERFSDQVHAEYASRYYGLPPHD